MILIPNLTGPTNIGDRAILEGLLPLLHQSFPSSRIILHSTDIHSYEPQLQKRITPSLAQYILLDNTHNLVRLSRLFQIYIYIVLANLGLKKLALSLIPPQLSLIIHDYLRADTICLAGGGYLRSQPGITQSLNLLVQLAVIALATTTQAHLLTAPLSFGPFAYTWHTWLSAKLLSHFDFVSVRETYSQHLLSRFCVKSQIFPDTALLIRPPRHTKRHLKVIGFTIRNWGNPAKQSLLENSYSLSLAQLSRQHHLAIQPIVQVSTPEFPRDSDETPTQRVVDQLHHLGAKVLPTIHLKSLNQALSVYSSLEVILSMRLHSAILSAVVGTPFFAVSYEHKTEGTLEQLGLSAQSIPWHQVTPNKLYKLIEESYNNKVEIKRKLSQGLTRVRTQKLFAYIPMGM